MSVAFNKFNTFALACLQKKHNLSSDTLKIALTNTVPVATNAVLADITQVANGNGYLTGGSQAAITSLTQSSGTAKLVLVDVTFTATGAVGPFQYAVLYNDTASNDELIGWWDHGSAITMANGDTYKADFDATTGVLTVL